MSEDLKVRDLIKRRELPDRRPLGAQLAQRIGLGCGNDRTSASAVDVRAFRTGGLPGTRPGRGMIPTRSRWDRWRCGWERSGGSLRRTFARGATQEEGRARSAGQVPSSCPEAEGRPEPAPAPRPTSAPAPAPPAGAVGERPVRWTGVPLPVRPDLAAVQERRALRPLRDRRRDPRAVHRLLGPRCAGPGGGGMAGQRGGLRPPGTKATPRRKAGRMRARLCVRPLRPPLPTAPGSRGDRATRGFRARGRRRSGGRRGAAGSRRPRPVGPPRPDRWVSMTCSDSGSPRGVSECGVERRNRTGMTEAARPCRPDCCAFRRRYRTGERGLPDATRATRPHRWPLRAHLHPRRGDDSDGLPGPGHRDRRGTGPETALAAPRPARGGPGRFARKRP